VKVLHVFDHSLPHHSGYAFRSESIVRALQERGVQTVHLTSPKHVHDGQLSEQIGDLLFTRCQQVITGGGVVEQMRCIRELRRTLRDLVGETQPDIIHCHSPCLTGVAAMGLGVPLVYEVRACWEDAAVSSGTTTTESLRYKVSRGLETYVAGRSDALVLICEGLKTEFFRRGIKKDKVSVVGNAVNPQSLPTANRARGEALRRSLGLENKKIIGFFGSFYEYEGLELLIESMPRILQSVPDAVVLLAGGGESENAVDRLTEKLGLEASVVRLGRIPHEQIGDCYGISNVMAFPRLKQKLTDMVTPLKPLEAGYLGTPVVASNVGGHLELINHDETGLLFEAGSSNALADALVRVLSDFELAQRLSLDLHRYVMRERLWSHMAERYEHIYRGLLTGDARAPNLT